VKPAAFVLSATFVACGLLGVGPGCGGVLGLKAGTLSDGGLGQPCDVLSNDSETTPCSTGLVCVVNECRSPCQADANCDADQRCVVEDSRGENGQFGCVPVAGIPCGGGSSDLGYAGGCTQPHVCDATKQCRTPCGGTSGQTCASDQSCETTGGAMACFGPHDVGFIPPEGGPPPEDGGGEDGGPDASATCMGSLQYGSCAQCGQDRPCSECPGCNVQPTSGSCMGPTTYPDCASCGQSLGCGSCVGCLPSPAMPAMCVGTPDPCTFGAYDPSSGECSQVPCTWDGMSCTGTPYPCSAFGDNVSCMNQVGCTWEVSPPACSGQLDPCNQLNGSAQQCASQSGCTWMSSACGGNLTPCQDLSPAECASQPGCSVAGQSTGGPPDACAATSSGGCNCLTLGPMVNTEVASGSPPPPQGGTVQPGTYVLTSGVLYTGSGGFTGPGPAVQITIQISGGIVQQVSSESGGAPQTLTATFNTNGSTFMEADTCPDSATRSGTYTATATTLVLELPMTQASISGIAVETFRIE